MASFKFDCGSCGNYATIKFKETDFLTSSDINVCPFCGDELSKPEEDDIEDYED